MGGRIGDFLTAGIERTRSRPVSLEPILPIVAIIGQVPRLRETLAQYRSLNERRS